MFIQKITINTYFIVVVALTTWNQAHAQSLSFQTPRPVNTHAFTDSQQAEDRIPSIAGDAQGNWIAVWFADRTIDTANGTDYDIYISRSPDNGATWLNQTAVNHYAAADLRADDEEPKIATDGNGTWIIVWDLKDESDELPFSDFPIMMTRSTDGGETWSDALQLSAPGIGASRPSISTDGEGNWIVFWGSTYTVSRDNGMTWAEPKDLSLNGFENWSLSRPNIRAAGDGTWIAVFQSVDTLIDPQGDRDITAIRSTDIGDTWSAPVYLNTDFASDTMHDNLPKVAGDGDGNWAAVWYAARERSDPTGDDSDVFVSHSTDDGITWTGYKPLNARAMTDVFDNNDFYPSIAADTNGDFVAVWTANGPFGTHVDYDIFFSRSFDGGDTWTTGFTVAQYMHVQEDGIDERPTIATNGIGRWMVVWDVVGDVLPGLGGFDYDILSNFADTAPQPLQNSWLEFY